MRKMFRIALLLMLSCVLLSGCFCQHEWLEATCEAPKTCEQCGKTEGDPEGHSWLEATCEAPKTCEKCEKTEGEALGHTVEQEPDCETAAKCSVCKAIVKEALGHKWKDATRTEPKTCLRCKEKEGEPLGILDIYPEGVSRHDGKTFLMDKHDYLELFNEIFNRGLFMTLPATFPVFDINATEDLYTISGAQGQQFRFETDRFTQKVTRIFVELNDEAEYTEDAMTEYLQNVSWAYMAAHGDVLVQEFLDDMKETMQTKGNDAWTCSGCMDGVAYRLEVRYHYMVMEIWVEGNG